MFKAIFKEYLLVIGVFEISIPGLGGGQLVVMKLTSLMRINYSVQQAARNSVKVGGCQ